MTWYIFVIMMGFNIDGSKDTYLYTKPTLPSLEECQRYVYDNSNRIRLDMIVEYQGKQIEQVFCIEEDKLKKFFGQMEDGIKT